MSTGFVFSLIFIVLALIIVPFIRRIPEHTAHEEFPARSFFKGVVGTFTALGLLLLLMSSITMVSPRTVAIATEFGKPTASFGNGLHFVAPWAEVTEMDGAVQTDSHTGDGAIKVRLAQKSIGYADTTVRWRIKSNEADQLFLDYREFEKIRDSLVTRELGAAYNTALADFDPLAIEGQPTQQQIGDEVQRILRSKIGDRIEVISVITPLVRFDEKTQKRIDALQAAVADTAIAKQGELTAAADARANKILSDSIKNDPNVVVSRCMDNMRESSEHYPPGFQCWPGTGGSVVVPSGK